MQTVNETQYWLDETETKEAVSEWLKKHKDVSVNLELAVLLLGNRVGDRGAGLSMRTGSADVAVMQTLP